MYYLQSRYYSPELCRWISADVFMDTGDDVLGTNMYAYCQGDPVNFVDPDGFDKVTPWWQKVGLNYPGEIHQVVIADIIAKNPNMEKEVYVRIKGESNFRIDLKRGNEIWEVKPANTAATDYIKAATKQLDKYIKRGKNATPGFTQNFRKGSALPGGTIWYNNGLTSFKITYWYAGEGIIQ